MIIEDYANLPADVVLPSESPETGRVNKATVLALKARAALYAASPLFNPENDPELWHRAATANKELLDYCVNERGMKLVSDYASLWDKNNYKNATDELILAVVRIVSLAPWSLITILQELKVEMEGTVRHKIWWMRMRLPTVMTCAWSMERGLRMAAVCLTRQNHTITVTRV